MPLNVEPEDSDEFESQSFSQWRIDPFFHSTDRKKPSPVWAKSQALRKLLDERGRPVGDDREELRNSVLRQLPSLGLYDEVRYLRTLPAKEKDKISISRAFGLYVILFPGEARDNTGIKDLNDKVLGYDLNTEWMALRQQAVAEIFWQKGNIPPPKWLTVGQDYKTAYVFPLGKSVKDFAKDLVRPHGFDAKLRDYLLLILKKAEREIKDQNKQKEIKKLKRKLERDKNYRFDFLFGFVSFQPSGSDKTVDVVFRLITEALKGAAVARFGAKGQKESKSSRARKIVTGKNIKRPPRDEDSRGLAYDNTTYLRVSWAAREIKDEVARGNRGAYNAIYANKVWIPAFLYYRERYFGHPDMIREVRKKLNEKPPSEIGWLPGKRAERSLLELYLITLNMVDFVAGFVRSEFHKELVTFHDLALAALVELQSETTPIDWDRLVRLLTRDIRLTSDRRIVLGTTSEFQFYAYSSDYADQIFFVMDVRDLGVDLMAFYEIANVIVTDDRLQESNLLDLTLRAGDPTVQRKRVTYDTVVAVLRNYFKILLLAGSKAAAEKAFGARLQAHGRIPDFDHCVQVMLGGDEIFVAAHVYFAQFEAQIISDLASATYEGLPLNLRTAVAYSSAKRVPKPSGKQGPSDPQREENFFSHHNTLELSGASHGFLKGLERTHRRIELYIRVLETVKQKKDLAPPFAKQLEDLHLRELYARSRFVAGRRRPADTYDRLFRMMATGDLKGAADTGEFDLVDFSGRTLDIAKLLADVEKLELAVKKAVGRSNSRPWVPDDNDIKRMKRAQKAIDDWADRKGPWKDYDEKPR